MHELQLMVMLKQVQNVMIYISFQLSFTDTNTHFLSLTVITTAEMSCFVNVIAFNNNPNQHRVELATLNN